MSMAMDVIEAIRNLQPTALPAYVTVRPTTEKTTGEVTVRVAEELDYTCKTRVNTVTGSLPVKVVVEK